ncbi:methyltransferase domain-containing protein [Hyphomicrobium sp.]|uniref:class I SAM-dependent methyltransferase n=1 Tax=Hyphomicrobium sp. TaxID=82 RepID=UPI000FB4C266|nr:methyltransferase domain-containing protein [Hyphomicrobium sp.]RUO99474.1 MAG: methyltransferase domain-containing protein [Hyphomicrobium sp.]
MSDNEPSTVTAFGAQRKRAGAKVLQLDEGQVRDAYRRWAPVYDYTFGAISTAGRRHAAEIINAGSGRVLEVGVGTGLALPNYKSHLDVVGIDLAPEMLDKARERVKAEKLTNISGLYEMDAGNLSFADNSFDTTVAMYVITVVPDPTKVMQELARVTKPGGEVLLVNHFSQDEGVRGWVERQMAPFADLVGWHSVFDVSRVMVCPELKLIDRKALRPWGIFTMMRFRKDAASVSQRPEAAE